MPTNDIMMRFPEGRAKALTFSYDDGVRQDMRLAAILDRYGMKATFNLNSGLYAEDNTHRRMTKDEITAFYQDSQHEVALHSQLHPFLESIPVASATREILRDREALEAQFGRIVRGMAYPMGTYSDEVVNALRACGVAYARTTETTERFKLPTDWLRMPATCHHKNPRLMELADLFVNTVAKYRPAMLFYVWGHSYEFDDCNNWNVIEEFAEYMGGREDEIWYATNIEIYEYVEDFKRIVCSTDCRIVKNPTARTLWFLRGKQICSIAPGEILKFED